MPQGDKCTHCKGLRAEGQIMQWHAGYKGYWLGNVGLLTLIEYKRYFWVNGVSTASDNCHYDLVLDNKDEPPPGLTEVRKRVAANLQHIRNALFMQTLIQKL